MFCLRWTYNFLKSKMSKACFIFLSISSFYVLLSLKNTLSRVKKDLVNDSQSVNILILSYTIGMWVKLRILYYINNWVYTTNHKRIAVNYYWFVIFSGICGMILATIIRLEMAYPGVGVLAGDSLQYLSVVTAHAVIMVFFMIMPLLFGAFGNFLLPTQLGVHDVAFPRLNSAAFWFLPAGLLMLIQLVCLDRRYQRMNCYNIREIQTLLKSQYSPNSNDLSNVNFWMNETVLGLRYKLMYSTSVNSSMFNYYLNSLAYNSHPIWSLNSTLVFLRKFKLNAVCRELNAWEHETIHNFFNLNSRVLNSLSFTMNASNSNLSLVPMNDEDLFSNPIISSKISTWSLNSATPWIQVFMISPINVISKWLGS